MSIIKMQLDTDKAEFSATIDGEVLKGLKSGGYYTYVDCGGNQRGSFMLTISQKNSADVLETITKIWEWTFPDESDCVAIASINDLKFSEISETAAQKLMKVIQGSK